MNSTPNELAARGKDPTGWYGLARLTGLWFLGLAGIYLLYGWSAVLGLEGDTTVLERVMMVLAPSMAAFALLVSPSLFAAGLGHVDGFDRNPVEILARRWAVLALFAGFAYLLSVTGAIASSLTLSGSQQPLEGPGASSATLELARRLVPFVICAFVPVSGVAGVLVGHATKRWRPLWRNTSRWVSCVTLMASFLLPFLATVDSIALHGASATWIILNPLALPLILTTVVALRERHYLGVSISTRWGRTDSRSVDAESLDRIVTKVTGHPEWGVDPPGLTEPEREMALLVATIRSIAGHRARPSESRVQEIVRAMVAASPAAISKAASSRRPRFDPSKLGGFGTSWTCLAVGLLIVSPLGGVPISVVSAVAVGFLGSAGIVLVARRFPELATTVPT